MGYVPFFLRLQRVLRFLCPTIYPSRCRKCIHRRANFAAEDFSSCAEKEKGWTLFVNGGDEIGGELNTSVYKIKAKILNLVIQLSNLSV